jgi:hypothetical protein
MVVKQSGGYNVMVILGIVIKPKYGQIIIIHTTQILHLLRALKVL